jgi:hypothetical protein
MNDTTLSLNFCEALTIASWDILSKVILLILKPSMVPQPRVLKNIFKFLAQMAR